MPPAHAPSQARGEGGGRPWPAGCGHCRLTGEGALGARAPGTRLGGPPSGSACSSHQSPARDGVPCCLSPQPGAGHWLTPVPSAGYCTGWGDPHYVTFDGLYYSYQGNCTYVLVEEATPTVDNFGVYIDNYHCDVNDQVSCPRTLIVRHETQEVLLKTVHMMPVTVQVCWRASWCGPPLDGGWASSPRARLGVGRAGSVGTPSSSHRPFGDPLASRTQAPALHPGHRSLAEALPRDRGERAGICTRRVELVVPLAWGALPALPGDSESPALPLGLVRTRLRPGEAEKEEGEGEGRADTPPPPALHVACGWRGDAGVPRGAAHHPATRHARLQPGPPACAPLAFPDPRCLGRRCRSTGRWWRCPTRSTGCRCTSPASTTWWTSPTWVPSSPTTASPSLSGCPTASLATTQRASVVRPRPRCSPGRVGTPGRLGLAAPAPAPPPGEPTGVSSSLCLGLASWPPGTWLGKGRARGSAGLLGGGARRGDTWAFSPAQARAPTPPRTTACCPAGRSLTTARSRLTSGW